MIRTNDLFKTEELTNATEELIVTGMIHSTKFLAVAHKIIDLDYFENYECKTVAKLCIKFFKENEEAPQTHILDLVDSIRDKVGEDSELLDAFLRGIDEKYGGREIHHRILETTYIDWAKLRALKTANDEIERLIEKGRTREAELRMEQLRTALENNSIEESIDVAIRDAEVQFIRRTSERVIVKFHNDLDDFMPPQTKGRFYTFLGGKKTGKSQWLEYIAIAAAESDLNVLAFTFELTRGEYLHRLYCGTLGCRIEIDPDRPNQPRTIDVELPVFDCEYNRSGTCSRPERPDNGDWGEWRIWQDGVWEPCDHCMGSENFAPVAWKQRERMRVIRTDEEFHKEFFKWKRQYRGDIRVVAAEPGTMTVSDIKSTLNKLKLTDNFIPDVIVVDYADNLVPASRYSDKRHELANIWLELSALAKSGYLVWTASQTNRTGWGAKWIEDHMIAEDASKLMVVDGMVTINEHVERGKGFNEKYWGVQRLRAHDYRSARIPNYDIFVLNDFSTYQACIECCKMF